MRPKYQQPFDLSIYFYVNTLNLTILRSGEQKTLGWGKFQKGEACKIHLYMNPVFTYIDTPPFMNIFRVPISCLHAPVAQWIERWIPNPCAAGSIPAGGTNNFKYLYNYCTLPCYLFATILLPL